MTITEREIAERLIAAAKPFLDPAIVTETTGTIPLMERLEAAIADAQSLLAGRESSPVESGVQYLDYREAP